MRQKRYHILIDLSHIETSLLQDAQSLRSFLQELPGVIDMHVLKGPEIAVGIPENPGVTGFVIIDYSHISVHTFTEYGEALIDIFSCKPYDQEKAILATLTHFNARRDNAHIQEVCWG